MLQVPTGTEVGANENAMVPEGDASADRGDAGLDSKGDDLPFANKEFSAQIDQSLMICDPLINPNNGFKWTQQGKTFEEVKTDFRIHTPLSKDLYAIEEEASKVNTHKVKFFWNPFSSNQDLRVSDTLTELGQYVETGLFPTINLDVMRETDLFLSRLKRTGT